MIWSIDGVSWDIPCQIERTAQVSATDISGFMLNGAYFNDVMGTYMRYEVAIAVPLGQRDQFYDVYEKLTEPVGSHTFILPYNGSTVEFTGRVEDVSDAWVYKGEGDNWWTGARFTATANTPTKAPVESSVENYGLSPYPMTSEVPEGGLYEKTEDGWQPSTITVADEVYY